MFQQPYKLLALLLAGWLIAACESQPSTPADAPSSPGSAPGVEEPPTAPPPPPPPAFNDGMEPYYPGTTRLLERVFYFEFDRAVLNAADLEALAVHAQVLQDNPSRRVVIEGHCDERGTREYNLALGERRADAVRSYLAAAGISGSRVETVSYGEERPDDPGSGEDAWARNRRAVMIYR